MSEWKGGDETKPSWDDTYMALAFTIAQRSVDKNTVHGAIMVSKDNRLLSMGYNGPLRGVHFDESDLTDRPNKYWLMIHAEENCIINYHGSHSDLVGATMYITGEPCHRCLRMILQKGIRRIVYGSVGSSKHCIDDADRMAKELMIDGISQNDIKGMGITTNEGVHLETWYHKELEYYQHEDPNGVRGVLNKTLNYIDYKEKS
jgi:dCMP deaminase